MDTTTLIIIVAAAIFAVVVALLLRRLSWGSSPGYTELSPGPTTPPQSSPKASRERSVASPVQLDPAAERELRELVARGQKIEAIKRVRELTGLGLKEAKDYVESLPLTPTIVAAEPAAEVWHDEREIEREARALLDTGNTIAAVKRVRELTGWGLRESREYVQSLSPTQPGSAPPPTRTTPQFSDPATDPDVQIQLAKGNKIQAIKRVRELTGWGLKEAKDYVDGLE
jgi:ribosomal protein L7/L12